MQSRKVSFRVDVGTQILPCSISGDALLDLGAHHRVNGTGATLFEALYQQITRLVDAKYSARRIEENGEIAIGTADLLLYGFEGSIKLPADLSGATSRRAGSR